MTCHSVAIGTSSARKGRTVAGLGNGGSGVDRDVDRHPKRLFTDNLAMTAELPAQQTLRPTLPRGDAAQEYALAPAMR